MILSLLEGIPEHYIFLHINHITKSLRNWLQPHGIIYLILEI